MPDWTKRSSNFEVLKTFCGEVAVLVLVFPLLDWYLKPPDPARTSELRVILWSPVVVLFFFSLAIVSSQLEKKFEGIEKGEKQ